MLIHAGKYRTEDKLKIQKLNTTQKKQTTQNAAKQNYPGSVASFDTRPGNKVSLFYSAHEPTRGYITQEHWQMCLLPLLITVLLATHGGLVTDKANLISATTFDPFFCSSSHFSLMYICIAVIVFGGTAMPNCFDMYIPEQLPPMSSRASGCSCLQCTVINEW